MERPQRANRPFHRDPHRGNPQRIKPEPDERQTGLYAACVAIPQLPTLFCRTGRLAGRNLDNSVQPPGSSTASPTPRCCSARSELPDRSGLSVGAVLRRGGRSGRSPPTVGRDVNVSLTGRVAGPGVSDFKRTHYARRDPRPQRLPGADQRLRYAWPAVLCIQMVERREISAARSRSTPRSSTARACLGRLWRELSSPPSERVGVF